jgi:hypothetical protein
MYGTEARTQTSTPLIGMSSRLYRYLCKQAGHCPLIVSLVAFSHLVLLVSSRLVSSRLVSCLTPPSPSLLFPLFCRLASVLFFFLLWSLLLVLLSTCCTSLPSSLQLNLTKTERIFVSLYTTRIERSIAVSYWRCGMLISCLTTVSAQ